jgi:hypothetical protein
LTGGETREGPVLLALAKSAALYGTAIAAIAGRRVATTVAGYLIVFGLFAVSFCFLTLSGYRAISQALGDVYAALIVGCIYLMVGLVAMLVMQFRHR